MPQRSFASAIALSSIVWFGSAAAAATADCGGADRIVSGKLRALLVRDDAFSQTLAAHSLPSLEQARALCAGPFVEAALRLYGRLLLDMEMQLVSVPEPTRTAEPAPSDRR